MPNSPKPVMKLNTRKIFQPHELCGQHIQLLPGGQVIVTGSETDLKDRLRHGVIRDCVIDCRMAKTNAPAMVVQNTVDCVIDNLYILGAGLKIRDAWNLNLTNCTVMNAWQWSDPAVAKPRPGVVINSSAGTFRTNDVMFANCRLEAAFGPVLSADNVALLLIDGCKIHGTGKRRPRKYKGPLIKLKNCQGTQIRAAFAHADVTSGEGIVEVEGDRDCTTRIEGVRQRNCKGPTFKNRSTSKTKVDVLQPS